MCLDVGYDVSFNVDFDVGLNACGGIDLGVASMLILLLTLFGETAIVPIDPFFHIFLHTTGPRRSGIAVYQCRCLV